MIAADRIWVVDLDRGVSNRLVSNASMPMPSPDGNALAYGADRTGVMDVYLRRRNGRTIDEEPLIQTKESKYVNDWSADGRSIVFQSSFELDGPASALTRSIPSPHSALHT